MAMIKLTPEVGALQKQLDQRRLTKTDFAKSVGMSRNTIKAVNDGVPKKVRILEDIAKNLKIPVSHLLASTDTEKSAPGTSNENPENRVVTENGYVTDTITYKKADAFLIAGEAMWSVTLEWSLSIQHLTDETASLLRTFEKQVRKYVGLDKDSEWPEGFEPPAKEIPYSQSLSRQIDNSLLDREINELIDKLGDLGAHIYVGGYWKWSKEKDLALAYGDPPPMAEYYKSEYVAKIVISNQNVVVLKKKEAVGWEPPKKAPDEGPLIFINDRWLEPEIPF